MTSSKTKLTVLFGVAAVGAMSAFCGDADDTVAFYGFKEAAPGTDATTVTLVNAVDASKYAGTVTTFETAETESAATFSDDAPGAYIYSSSRRGAKMICERPQSIHLSAVKNSKGCGGTLAFADLATELSKHHDTGFTVEFYFKAVEETDPYYSYSYTFLLNCGYTKVSGGALTSFNIYAPCDSISKLRYGFGGYGSSYPGNSAGSKNLTKIHDGKWHRLALIETAPDETGAQKIMFYVDGNRNFSLTIPAAEITLTERTDSVAYSLGLDHLCGKYSCVRMTNRALETDEFMTIGGRAPAAMPEGTVAFYPFDEGEIGASAVGETVFNVLDPLYEKGTVTLGTKAGAAVTFDADAPAKYIFAGDAYKAQIVYTNPASLKFTSEESGGSGSVSFSGLGALTSQHHENGHTIEYFLKLEDSDFAGYSSSLSASCGYVETAGGNAAAFQLYMPFAMAYGSGRQFRYALTSYNEHSTVSTSLSYDLWQTGWHHVALVEQKTVTPATEESAETTNVVLAVYVDYVKCGTGLSLPETKVLTGSQAIALCNSCHHGKYSCLRVTDHALDPSEFLHASNYPTFVKKTIVHWSFDEFADQPVSGTISNRAPVFAEDNPGLYLPATSRLDGSFASGDEPAASFEAARSRQTLLTGVEDSGSALTNAGSVRVVSKTDGKSSLCTSAPASIVVSVAVNNQVTPGDFTCEGFFRFDGAGWKANMGSYASARSMSLLMRLYYSGGSKVIWSLRLGNLASEKHDLSIQALTAGGQTVSASDSGDYFNDGKWHHVAVTHDVDAGKLCVYYDYAPAFEITDVGALKDNSAEWGYLGMGYGSTFGLNDFYGRFDEFRYSRGVLTTDEMLHLDGEPTGMMILFR